MADETPGRTDIEGEQLEGETGIGAGDQRISSTEKPAEVLPDDAPDNRSGLATEDDGETEEPGDAGNFSSV